VPSSRLMRVRPVPKLDCPSAGFVQRLFLDSRARAITELESAGWPLGRIGVELDRRGLDDLNGKAWTSSRLTQVALSARQLGLIPSSPTPSTTFSTTTAKGGSWIG